MSQLEETVQELGWGRERRRVKSVVDIVAPVRNESESMAAVAHDARNMVAALGLYCDLLEEPGVLAAPYGHYAQELRLLATASHRLVEKLVALDCNVTFGPSLPSADSSASTPRAAENRKSRLQQESGRRSDRRGGNAARGTGIRTCDLLSTVPVENLAAELLANRDVLAALARPAIALTVETIGGVSPVFLTGEELTRILVNLVKNASEAMPAGGCIRIGLSERPAADGVAGCALLTIEDNGPGIPPEALEQIFTPGFTTRSEKRTEGGGWQIRHRGLGLAIVRSIVEAADGRVWAANSEQGGARFTIELPIRQSHAVARSLHR
jgi:signal transduction histidine kinase